MYLKLGLLHIIWLFFFLFLFFCLLWKHKCFLPTYFSHFHKATELFIIIFFYFIFFCVLLLLFCEVLFVVWYHDFSHYVYVYFTSYQYLLFPVLTMEDRVVSSSSSCLVRSSTRTTACLTTLPTIRTRSRYRPLPPSSRTTWTGSGLLAEWWPSSSCRDSCWMCSSRGQSTSLCLVGKVWSKRGGKRVAN